MNLLPRYKHFINQENLFSPKDKLLLAVSGGIDSVVLCELCKQAEYDFTIVHCNFQLRGEESERDEKFVRQLSEKYKAELKVKKFDTEKFAEENKMSIQEAARVLRYEWFEELVDSLEFGVRSHELLTLDSRLRTFLLTAHHANDNAETMLMNFCRGTGLHGLTGIPVSYGNIKRPLLCFTKEELLAFANENKLEFVEDSSNLSTKYTRNLFRHEIIPAISKVYPQVNENLNDNINRFKEIEKLYKLAVNDIKKKLVKEKGSEWHIPVKQLMGYNNRALIYEIIADFGFTEKQIDEVIKLAESESGKYFDSPTFNYRFIKHRHWFIISPTNSADSRMIIIEENDKKVLFEEGIIEIESLQTSNLKPQTSNNIACLDSKEIKHPLILRKWKTGDYFYPLGMKKRKNSPVFLLIRNYQKRKKKKPGSLKWIKKLFGLLEKELMKDLK